MITRSQANTFKAKMVDLVVENYPEVHAFLIRAAISHAKASGPGVKTRKQAVLRELYQIHTGTDPVGNPSYRPWIRQGIQDNQLHLVLTGNTDPLTGITNADNIPSTPEDIV